MALRKSLESLVLEGLEPSSKLPPPLGILEEVYEEKIFKKIFLSRLDTSISQKNGAKNQITLTKLPAVPTVQSGGEFFFAFFTSPIIWPSLKAFSKVPPRCTGPQATKEVRRVR